MSARARRERPAVIVILRARQQTLDRHQTPDLFEWRGADRSGFAVVVKTSRAGRREIRCEISVRRVWQAHVIVYHAPSGSRCIKKSPKSNDASPNSSRRSIASPCPCTCGGRGRIS